MKTICFFNSTKAWGGGEKWHFEACTHLHANGYPVMVIAHLESELYKRLLHTDIQCQGIHVTNFSFLNFFKIRAVEKILRQKNVGTIIINLSRDVKLAGIASKWAGVSRIIYRRGSAIPIKDSILNRYYFSHIITEILANSEATKKTILERNQDFFPKDKINVIYNGIDSDVFLDLPLRPLYKKRDADEIVLSNLGRLEFQKNQKFLMYLAAELNRRKLNFKMLIGGEGRLREELHALSKKLQIHEQVLFTGFVKNPKDLICSGDIFMLSSLWEGFGYVLAEASLCKKPIIAFDCSSNPEVVEHGITGYLTPVDDIEAFADKIQYLAEHPQQRKEMGERGFAFAREHFDSEKIQGKILKYLVNG